ncbi:hypothetical protein DVJ78_18320 (plasmid) [Humibacter sp. BT305]|nr:hypothetical protein DVJ78_18320 [Humibacter sp. BT305]
MTTNWTLVPIPEQDRTDVEALVIARQLERQEAAFPTNDEIRDPGMLVDVVRRNSFARQTPWPVAALERLANAESITEQRWAIVLDYCASRPNELFSTEQIAEATGMSVEDWRSACRNLKKYLKRDYAGYAPAWGHGDWEGQTMWPAATASGRQLRDKNQLFVGLSAEQASRWLQVRR